MKETDIYDFYRFGYNYGIWKGGLKNTTNSYVKKSVEEYLEVINELELQVTSKIISELEELLEDLEDNDNIVDESIAGKIKDIMEGADKTLDAELQLKKVLIVTPKRFNSEMLLKYPSKLLAKNSDKYMTINAKKDFLFAARCVAMNLSTAAAFHLMRCVEEMVKQLYFCFIKQNRLKKPMWGPMVEKLRNKNRPRPPEELLDHLDVLRRNFRNPTQHPEKFYTIDEAQDLLHSSIVAINMIANSIAVREPA